MTEHDRLSVAQGNVVNAQMVAEVIREHDVVISVLGVRTSQALRGDGTIISEGARNIVGGMKLHGVRRLLFVTSFGVSADVFWPEKLLLKTLLKRLFQDNLAQEALIRESGLDWTIVRPARLTSGPETGDYKTGEHLMIGPFSHIDRSDVADFLVRNVENPDTVRRTLNLSR